MSKVDFLLQEVDFVLIYIFTFYKLSCRKKCIYGCPFLTSAIHKFPHVYVHLVSNQIASFYSIAANNENKQNNIDTVATKILSQIVLFVDVIAGRIHKELTDQFGIEQNL